MGTIKCVVVGDGGVGKTSLLIRYAKDDFPTAHVRTVFDSYSVSVPMRGETYELYLFDTAGQEDYDQLRRIAFPNTNILLVCFSVEFWTSFKNARELWVPEVRKYCPGVPYILVGTKIDLRSDRKTLDNLAADGESPITKAQGEKLAKELGAVKYVECSALTKENLNDVFHEAILTAHHSSNDNNSNNDSTPQKDNCCSVL